MFGVIDGWGEIWAENWKTVLKQKAYEIPEREKFGGQVEEKEWKGALCPTKKESRTDQELSGKDDGETDEKEHGNFGFHGHEKSSFPMFKYPVRSSKADPGRCHRRPV